MKKLLTLTLILFPFWIQGQITIVNPGLNGMPPLSGSAPEGWTSCVGSPDLQPGQWGVIQATFEGSSYAGFHSRGLENIRQEVMEGRLSDPILAGETYQFSFQMTIAPLNLFNNSQWIPNNQGDIPAFVEIWGSVNSCSLDEMLWRSPIVLTGTGWNLMTPTLSPTANYNFISFHPVSASDERASYIGIDDMSSINVVGQNLVCTNPRSISCGETDNFGTFNEADDVSSYCNGTNVGFGGDEVVYLIEPSFTGDHTFRLSGVSAGRDLDMFLLNSCDENDCIADSDGASGASADVIVASLVTGNVYYLVVDTDLSSGSGESNYSLSVTCGDEPQGLVCTNTRSISCGETDNFGTFNEADDVSSYCNGTNVGFGGDEVVYLIEPSFTGDYTFRLSGVSAGRDLDMFLLNSCDENDCIADSDGASGASPDVMTVDLVAGNVYYLVVDTDLSSGSGESNYSLSVTCGDEPQGLVCTNTRSISCGETDNFGTFNEADDVSSYCNGTNVGFGGDEVVYLIEPSFTGDYTFRLSGVSAGRDLDMFLLNSCDENDCIADSDGASGASADVIVASLVAGNVYYLVVDTDLSSGIGESNYSLSVNCEQVELPCDCCPDGPQHTFEDQSVDALPAPGSVQAGWQIEYGFAAYFDEGCSSAISIELPGAQPGNQGSGIEYSISGFAGPSIQFEEGRQYCISYCYKVAENPFAFGGNIKLRATNDDQFNATCQGVCTVIDISPVITQADGWVTHEFIWTADADYFALIANSEPSAPVEVPMLIDNICISENIKTCKAAFTVNELECGHIELIDESCGETLSYTWVVNGITYNTQNVNLSGPNTFDILLTVNGPDGCSDSVSKVITTTGVAPPVLDCPIEMTLVGQLNASGCSASYTIPNIVVSAGGNYVLNCTLNGSQAVLNPGDILTLPVGSHSFLCTATDECDNVAECQWTIIVQCPPPLFCDCCEDGPQHTFEDQVLGDLPAPNTIQAGWQLEYGFADFVEDGCESLASVALSGLTRGSPGSAAEFSISGFAGPEIQFEEGKDYCFSYCFKVGEGGFGDELGNIKMRAVNQDQTDTNCQGSCALINVSPTIHQSDGWVTHEFTWTAPADFLALIVSADNTSQTDAPPPMLFDNVCISEYTKSCQAAFTYTELPCEGLQLINQSCGNDLSFIWLVDEVTYNTEDVDVGGFGTFIVSLTVTGADGCSDVITDTITTTGVASPVIDCPANVGITGMDTADGCFASYTVPAVNVTSAVNVLLSCSYNGTSVSPGDIVTLVPGVYTFSCVAADECGNIAECQWTVSVECTPELFCPCCPDGPQHTFESEVPGPVSSFFQSPWKIEYGNPVYSAAGCADPVSIVITGTNVDGTPGSAVDYSTSGILGPDLLFEKGKQYCISYCTQVTNGLNKAEFGKIVLRATNDPQANSSCSGFCDVIHTSQVIQLNRWDTVEFVWTAPDDFYNLIFSAESHPSLELGVTMRIDDVCISEYTQSCHAAFTYNELECGYLELINQSCGDDLSYNWNVDGLTYTTQDVNLPGPGTFDITLSVLGADGCMDTTSIIITTLGLDPPVLECASDTIIQVASVGDRCFVTYQVPQLKVTASATVLCTYNSSPVDPGDVLSLPEGDHSFVCVARDTCGGVAECAWTVSVDCTDPSGPCMTFDEEKPGSIQGNFSSNIVTLLDNWQTRCSDLQYTNDQSQNGTQDVYLKAYDRGCGDAGSWTFNSVDFQGDWANDHECLCYDFRMFNDGGAGGVTNSIYIYSGANDPFGATYLARFVLNDSITTTDDWVTICPPIALSSAGVLPSNSEGQWMMTPSTGSDAADWDALISNVTGVGFPQDLTSSPTEVYCYDNICFNQCAPPPILCGGAVISCYSTQGFGVLDPNGFVLGIVNSKNWASAPLGSNWTSASSTIYHHPSWTAANMGEIFGIAIDAQDNIYATATSMFGTGLEGPAGSGGIYKIDPFGNVTNFVTTGSYSQGSRLLPNDGAGLGNICYDPIHNQLFVTNFYDGQIYRIDMTGTVQSRFEPFPGGGTSTSTPTFSNLGHRPWGIAYHPQHNRLYFSNWNSYSGGSTNTTIHSVPLTASGDYVPASLQLDITLSMYKATTPISDIAVSNTGRLLLSGKSMRADYALPGQTGSQWAHVANVYEYEFITTWQLTPGHGVDPKYTVGGTNRRDAAGGIDYGYESAQGNDQPILCDESVWASGDYLHGGLGNGTIIYGMQGFGPSGGFNANSILIDYDNDLGTYQKGGFGDVEIFKCGCYEPMVHCDSLMVMGAPVEVPCIDSSQIDPNQICTAEFLPVCGCDGVTYSNSCEADKAGVTYFISGQCDGSNPPNIENLCCYTYDIKNNWGDDIVLLDVEVLNKDWQFSNVTLAAPFTFGSNNTNDYFDVINSTGLNLPIGVTTDAITLCFAPAVTNPSGGQEIEFRWWRGLDGGEITVECRDTLPFDCKPIPLDTCFSIIDDTLKCVDQLNPYEYQYCFKVDNQSGFDIKKIILEDLPPGFNFLPLNTTSKIVTLTTPLPNQSVSTEICCNIQAAIPILEKDIFCLKMGLVNTDGDECCHEEDLICTDILPCCDPCEGSDLVFDKISTDSTECCFSVDLINECFYNYFTKVEAEVLTPGVCFGSHLIGAAHVPDWNVTSTPQKICMEPSSGHIDALNYDELLTFCLDKLDDPIKDNPIVVFRWYYDDAVSGEKMIACTDTLVTDCKAPRNNDCVVVTDQKLECIQDSSKYRYTFTIKNTSNAPFTAHKLHLEVKNAPNDYQPFPTGPVMPLTPSLPPGSSRTISTCIVGTTFPATLGSFQFSYRLEGLTSGDCCFESVCDTIPIPPCDTLCCGITEEMFCDQFEKIITPTINKCEYCYDFPSADSCTILSMSIDRGPLLPVSSEHICIPGPGVHTVCFLYELRESIQGDLCISKDTCFTIEIPCNVPTEPCIDIVNIETKDIRCNLADCNSGAFCHQWIQDYLFANASSCTGLYLDKFEQAIWQGETVYIATSSAVPDASYQIVFDCHGNILQQCNNTIAGDVCSPDLLTIDIFSNLTSITTLWNCGDIVPIPNSDCVMNTTCIDYCIKIMNSSNPPVAISQVNLNDMLGQNVQVTPSIFQFSQSLQIGDMTTINFTICGNVDRGDSLKFLMPYISEASGSEVREEECCLDTELCLVVPDCPDDCCQDEAAFCDLVDLGWEITIDGCEVKVQATQFDSCHWMNNVTPDWGDGSILQPAISPANGCWTHVYDPTSTQSLLTNGDFEVPDIGSSNFRNVAASTVPGWETDHPDGDMELWRSGFGGVTSQSGNAFMELNVDRPTTVWQDFVTKPGERITWEFFHRARRSGVEQVEVLIGSTTSTVSEGTFDAVATSWTRHSGSYQVPAGQVTTRIAFKSLMPNDAGNFIDQISVFGPSQDPTYVICATIFESINGVDECWSKVLCDTITVDCGPCDPTEPCLDIVNIETKEVNCNLPDCESGAFCHQWIRDFISTHGPTCSGSYLEKFEQADWLGQKVYIAISSIVPDLSYRIVFDCYGNILQRCDVTIVGETCIPDLATVDIFSALTSITTLWSCGDPMPTPNNDCALTDTCIDYCVKVMNNSNPPRTITQIDLNSILGQNVQVTPSIFQFAPGLQFGEMATINFTICGDIDPGDSLKFLMPFTADAGSSIAVREECCLDTELCLVVPECSDDCCEDEEAFCDLVDLGWQITIDGCEVKVQATQFDSCHWMNNTAPDWGDGSILQPAISPANGCWTHVYDTSGPSTYVICATIFESNDGAEACWSKLLCDTIMVDCGPICDSLPFPEIITPDICVTVAVPREDSTTMSNDPTICPPEVCDNITRPNGGLAGDVPVDMCIPTCDSSKITYFAVQNPGSTYEWRTDGGTIVGSNTLDSVCVKWTSVSPSNLYLIETNAEGCVDSTKICIEFIDSPNANFSKAPSPGCLNTGIQFTNLSTDADSWLWDFGDGHTSTDSSPIHSYSIPGTYTVTLTAVRTTVTLVSPRNSKLCDCETTCRCTDTMSMTITIGDLPGPPIYCVGTVCRGDTACYYTDLLCPGAIYNWNVTNGTIISGGTASDTAICVLWHQGPVGEISLQVPNCSNYCTMPTTINVPVIDDNILNIQGADIVCQGDVESYNVQKYQGAVYNWTAINGTILGGPPYSNAVSVLWNGVNAGELIVTVTDLKDACAASDTLDITILRPFVIGGQDNVCAGDGGTYFSFPGNASAGLIWTTTGGTIVGANGGNSISIDWDTGPGSYTVTAVPNQPGEFCNASYSYDVVVHARPPVPMITDGPLLICPGNTYNYSASANSGGAISWIATNGLVSPSTGEDVTVTWNSSGSGYSLSVYQTSDEDPYCISDTTTVLIDALQGITLTGPGQACLNSTTTYSVTLNPSNIFIDNIDWSISNASGSIISGQGTDSISVQWSNDPGSAFVKVDVCGFKDSIRVTLSPAQVPVFSGPTELCPGANDILIVSGNYNSANLSNGTLIGNVNNNPQFQINGPGTYIFTGVDNSNCTVQASHVVNAVGIDDHIHAVSSLIYCTEPSGSSVDIMLQAPVVNGYTYLWEKDCVGGFLSTGITTNIYTETGVNQPCSYRCLITHNGCTVVSNILSTVPDSCGGCISMAKADFSWNTCSKTKHFDGSLSANAASYDWQFGDGSIGSGMIIDHTYSDVGLYYVILRVADASGCVHDTSHIVEVPVVADFDWTLVDCNNGSPTNPTYQFTDRSGVLSDYNSPSYLWEFFDECSNTTLTSSQQNPLQELCSNCGAASSVRLIISATKGSTTCRDTIVKMIDPAGSTADAIIPIEGCVGEKITLTNTSCGDVSWLWNFGDGFTSALEHPCKTYENAGTYNISLVVSDQYGCESDPFIQSIVIHNDPIVTLSATPSSPEVCEGDPITLTATPGFSNYTWLDATTNLPVATTNSVNTYMPTTTGSYAAEVTDANGCMVISDPIQVTIHRVPDLMIEGDVELCEGDDLELSLPPSYGPYFWTLSGGGSTNNFTSRTLLVSNIQAETYSVSISVTGSSPLNCTKVFTTVVTVHPSPAPPLVNANPGSPFCEGDFITLSVSKIVPGLLYGWSTGDYGTSIALSPALAGGVKVTATDPNTGCSAESIPFIVNELPDVCVFPEGCFEVCDTDTLCLPDNYATYQWLRDGLPIPGANANCFIITQSGDYQVILGTAQGCVDTTGVAEYIVIDCFCEDLSISYLRDTTTSDSCCWLITIDNQFDGNYFKGISFDVNAPVTISHIAGLSGWNVQNYIPVSTAEVHPNLSSTIPIGPQTIARICTDQYTTNPHHVTASWLVDDNGTCKKECAEDVQLDCKIPSPDRSCLSVVADSVDCANMRYCIKVWNNSNPAFDINMVHLINLNLGSVNPNPVTIPLLPSGDTSDWICFDYTGLISGDTLCYNLIGHFFDSDDFTVTCCSDTTTYCTPIPPCCDTVEDPCDLVSISLEDGSSLGDSCCFVAKIDNQYCNDYFKGVKIKVNAPASISQVQTSAGWVISQLNPLEAEILPQAGTVPLGSQDIFSICASNDGSLFNIDIAWLVTDSLGNCIERCTQSFERMCERPSGCIEIVQDSIDCKNNMYCFRVVNNTSPEIIIKSVEFVWLSPNGTSLTPNPYSITPLSMGDTSEWICIKYDATGHDSMCFYLVGHAADLPAGEAPAWCCVDSVKHYINIKDDCPCNMDADPCDLLSIDLADDTGPVLTDLCCFVGKINNKYCDTGIKGVKIRVQAPASIAQVQTLNGWVINQLSPQEAEVMPAGGTVPLGASDVFRICTANDGTPFIISVSWLFVEDSGECVEKCETTFEKQCERDPGGCIEIVQDSIDCNNEMYCFRVINNTSPEIIIRTVQFNSLSPIGTSLIPNPISINPLSAGDTSEWVCVTYDAQPGDNVCFELIGNEVSLPSGDPSTWCCADTARYCFEVPIDCPPPPCDPGVDPCELLSIDLVDDTRAIVADLCCFVGRINNGYCDTGIKGIKISVQAPALISQVQTLNGWVINQLSPQEAEVMPLGGFVPLGASEVFRICTATDGSPFIITTSWLIADDSGVCVEKCPSRFEKECEQDPGGCIEVVQDSIDCNNEMYCFRVVNNTSPEIIIRTVQFNSLSPNGTSLTPNPISINPLSAGDTSEWVCVTYDAQPGDNVCFELIGNEVSLPSGDPSTWCCADTARYCFEVPIDCPPPPCDPVVDPCELLSIDLVDDTRAIVADLCCFVGRINNEYCDTGIKGIKISVQAPALISQMQTLNGWVINQLNPQEAEVMSAGGFVPLGASEVFRICTATDGSPFIITASWLIADDGGVCVEKCPSRFEKECEQDPGGCIEIVKDSIDCNNEMYCFRVVNNTSPEIIIRTVQFNSLSPTGTSLTPNSISINPLSAGDTSEWVCVTYDAQPGDNVCFELIGNEVSLPSGDPSTWCCADTARYCFEVPLVCPPSGPCDSLGVSVNNLNKDDACCHEIVLTNNYNSTYFKGVTISVDQPGTLGYLTAATGWAFQSYSQQSATLIPLSGYIPIGNQIAAQVCTEDYNISPHLLNIQWLVDKDGVCEEVCETKLELTCEVIDTGIPGCIQVVEDSLDCNLEMYCFKVQNLNPDIDVNYIQLINVLPDASNLSATEIPLPVLQYQEVSDWICIGYNNLLAGDQFYYNLTSHFEDDKGNLLVCCVDTVQQRILIPDCSPKGQCCDITDEELEARLDVATNLSIDGCEVCLPIIIDSCELLTVDYADGNVIQYMAGDTVCHTYATSETWSANIRLEILDGQNVVCMGLDTIIEVETSCASFCGDNVTVGNGLTPDNGDNINQTLIVQGLTPDCGSVTLTVYNRWGQEVWRQANYDNSWSGLSKSARPLASGTYFITIEFPDLPDKPSMKTFLDIRRE